jgi:hypothetical protein
MNSFRPTICALVLTITLSSSALAGNIGGLRTNAAGNIGGLRTNAAGNIGGLRISATGNIGGLRTSSAVNLDGSSNSSGRTAYAELAFSNIGGMILILLESAALF